VVVRVDRVRHGHLRVASIPSLKVKETSAVSPVATVTVCSCVPRRECQASMT
jgi:hypothetical protein